MRSTCSVEGCEGEVKALGLCVRHYQSQRWSSAPDVYRVRNDGLLKRLRRWPKELNSS
jgi:hypothetical protein